MQRKAWRSKANHTGLRTQCCLKTDETETQRYYAILNQPVNLFLPDHTPDFPSVLNCYLIFFLSLLVFFYFICIFLLFLLFCYYLQYLKSVWAAALLHSVIFADFSVSACRSSKGRLRPGWCCLTASGPIIRPKVLLATTFFQIFLQYLLFSLSACDQSLGWKVLEHTAIYWWRCINTPYSQEENVFILFSDSPFSLRCLLFPCLQHLDFSSTFFLT